MTRKNKKPQRPIQEPSFDIPPTLIDHPTNFSTPAGMQLSIDRVSLKKGDVVIAFKKGFKAGNVEFGIVEQNMLVKKKTKDEIILVPIDKAPDLSPKTKERLATEITAKIEKEIKEDIVDVVKESLKESKGSILKKIRDKLRKGEKAKVVKKRGCVYLNVGGSEVYL